MRKILLYLSLVALVFCFVSCGENNEKPPIPTTDRPFSSNANISYKGLSYTGFLTFRNGASGTLEITSPKSLEGLVFILSNGEPSAKYEGLDIPLSALDSQTKTAAGMIFSAIANAGVSSDVRINESKNEFSVSDKIYSQEFDMIFDRKSGAIKSFSVPASELLVTFENFKFLG